MLHLDDEILIGYAEERFDHGPEIKSHIETCSSCGNKVRDWSDLILLLKSAPTDSAPADAIWKCIALYRPHIRSVVSNDRTILIT